MARLGADRIGGLIWIVFGAAVVYGSWTMDRLEELGINPLTAPGLVPGLLGIGLIVLGLVLVLRRPTDLPDGQEPVDGPRLGLSFLLCLGFGAGLVGHGLPFWLGAAAFVFLHIVLIDESGRIPARPTPARLAFAAIVAVVSSAVVTNVFEKIFLITLP